MIAFAGLTFFSLVGCQLSNLAFLPSTSLGYCRAVYHSLHRMLLVLGQDRYLVLLRQKIRGWENPGLWCQKGGMSTEWICEVPSLAALHSVCFCLYQ